jgi:hypothetical protein
VVILYLLQPAMGTPNRSRLGAQIMALKCTKMEILLQLFGVVTTGKIFGQPELAARILPNIAKPLKNSAILLGNCQTGKIDVAEWQTFANHTSST